MIIYASRTGNVKSITEQLPNIPCIKLEDGLVPHSPFFIFTYTDGIGEVPKVVAEFMEKHHHLCKGVIASGNTNFGFGAFCASADKLKAQYGIPIIRKIEMRGFTQDYKEIEYYYDLLVRKGKF